MRILIYLNIPWEFIKQRPQFLAEKLGKYLKLTVYYNKPYKNTYIVERETIPSYIQLVKQVKVPRKNKLLIKLDSLIQRFFLKRYIVDVDYIWVMHPDQYESVEPLISNHKVIYDCMDDYGVFPHLTLQEQLRIKEIEKTLVHRADYVFYTSKVLQEKHKQRYDISKHTFVVNNAMEPRHSNNEDIHIKTYLQEIHFEKLVYIGAIAPWFDFEMILKLLEYNQNTALILFGPVDCEIPKHRRIFHYGKIPHESIYTAMAYADGLIMPFKVNDLIIAVDPIKVYEYIASGKPVIVPYYEEMEKFKPFVKIYHDEQELCDLVRDLNVSYTQADIDAFIRQNTWEARAKQIVHILSDGEK